jgi:hypothetical protein
MVDTNEDRTVDGTKRFSVQQAADILGISTEATRQRIKRGTLPTERDENGNVFVLLENDGTRTTEDGIHPNNDRTDDSTVALTSLAASQEDQIEFLRQQLQAEREANRENRRLLAAALERIPQIEAPQEESPPEPTGAHVSAAEDAANGTGSEDQEPQGRRSWWWRIFEG